MGFLKDEGLVYKAVDEVDLGAESDEVYIQANVKAPRVAGLFVKVFVFLLELPIFGGIFKYFLIKNNLIHKLVSNAELQEPPLFVPLHPYEGLEEKEVKYVEHDLSPPERVQKAVDCLPCSENISKSPKLNFRRWTIKDYSQAYKSQEITPLMVADHIIRAVRESRNPSSNMSFFINFNAEDILKQAKESTLRYERGEPTSILDGVPIAVKDEIDCKPYPTTGGTKWLHKVRSCKDDASCIERLRLCGAVLIGKANMHELGAGTSGINPHYGTSKNPYKISRISGGSSGGSAALVSAGLCPVALGVDGGGSVRMPAALCGVVGFKPSFGRVSHNGVLPMNWTVGMVGILAATVEDSLIVYAAMSDDLSSQNSTSSVPKLCFPMLRSPSPISGIKFAKYGKWYDDCTSDIKNSCSRALAKLHDKYGWKIVDVTIPDIEAMRLAHYVTMGSECSTALACDLEKVNVSELGGDARAALSLYSGFCVRDYLNAQRIRNRQLQFHKKIFSMADVIVTPTTGVTAYEIKDDVLQTGELDYVNGAALVRYQIAGNFLGLPAITIPVGYDKCGLPIGLQFIGAPWSESLLLHVAFAMQEICISDYKRPEVFYNILSHD